MVTPRYFLWLLLSFIELGHNRELWEPPIDEVSVTVLNRDEPVELEKEYARVQIRNLNGTLYTNSLSHLRDVKELRIVRNQIREIETGALCSSPGLKILKVELSGNVKPPVLAKDMFENCNLKELFLKFDYNNPSKMNPDALENIPNLETLGVDSLVINHLKKDFLKLKKNSLRKLILSNTQTSEIDEDALVGSSNLEILEITHVVQLVHLPKNLFKNASKLKRLVLKDNGIKDLTWDEFEGLSSLEELDVIDNQITHFDATKVAKNMPALKKIFLDLNPITCDDRKGFTQQLTNLGKNIEIPNEYNIYGDC